MPDRFVRRSVIGVEQRLFRLGICLVSGIKYRVDIFWIAVTCNRHGGDADWIHRDQPDWRMEVADRRGWAIAVKNNSDWSL